MGDGGGVEREMVERELAIHGLVQGDRLGHGAYGPVVSARKTEGQGVAVKILDHRRMSPLFPNHFLPRELAIHSALNHPNIVRLLQHWRGAVGPRTYIVLELADNGDLEQFITRRGRLEDTGTPGDLPRTIFRQLLLAVQYLHDNGIAHRDIKCENVFLTDTLTVKLGDFGFSRLQGMEQLSHTFCGSRPYAAPEVVRRLPYRGQTADWWSLGIVLFIMLEARFPFDDRNVRLMVQRQDEQALPFFNCPLGDARRLIRAFLQPVVANRICASAALRHPWFLIARPTASLPLS